MTKPFVVDDDFTIYVTEDPEDLEDDIPLESVEKPLPKKVELKLPANERKKATESKLKALKASIMGDVYTGTLDCPICTFKGKTNANFLSHLDDHLQGARVLKCGGNCKFTTLKRGALNSHRCQCQHYPYKFFCPDCNYVTVKHRNLQYHIENSKHLPDNLGKAQEYKPKEKILRTYMCEVCCSVFTNKGLFLVHKKKHKVRRARAVTVKKCDLCNYESRYRGNVIRHRQGHLNS